MPNYCLGLTPSCGLTHSETQSQEASAHQPPHTEAPTSQQGSGKPDVQCMFPENFTGSAEKLSQCASGLSLEQLVRMNCFTAVPQMPGREERF